MGGHDSYHPHGHHTFKEVWSPSGGWWCDPKGWRKNTVVAVGFLMLVNYAIFQFGAENEVRYTKPNTWVPSQFYAKFPDQNPQ